MMSSSSQLKKVTIIRNDRGHSAPSICAWQRGSGNYLAVRFEGLHVICIYDRQGKLYKKVSIPTNCTALEWDADGDVLAIMVETPGTIVLWEAHSGKMTDLDTGLRESSTIISWSNTGKVLALGTAKGNIMVYDHRTLRKIPVLGTHTKKVVCAKWSRDEIVAFGTADDQISLNTKTGELIRYLQVRGRPSDLQFGYIKEDQSTSSVVDNTISCIVSERTLYLMKYDDPSSASPMELGFQTRYGNILSHFWHGDGYIVVTFMGGFIVLLSSHHKEIGTELVLCELKDDIVRHASFNLTRGWLSVCCGTSTLEIHQASEPKNTVGSVEVADEEGRVRQIQKCHWTEDGQLLSVTTAVGDVILYLTSVPMMGGANFNQLACMSSLTECALYSFVSTTGQPSLEFTFTLSAQPNLLVLGSIHLAAIIHSSAHLYNTRKEISPYQSTPNHKKEFNSNISEFVINHTYCAARCGGVAHLHRIEGNGMEKFDVKSFPESNAKGFKITSMAMGKEVFLYGGENGQIKMFHLDQFTEIMTVELPKQSPVKGIFPDLTGGQCIFVDKHNNGYYFDVLRPNDSELSTKPLPKFPAKCDGVFFDMDFNCRHIFMAFTQNSNKVTMYSGWRDAARGNEEVEYVGTCEPFRSGEYRPTCLKKGMVCALTGTGRIERSKSLYHQQFQFDEVLSLAMTQTTHQSSSSSTDQKLNIIKGLVNLRLFNEAYELCCVNSERSDSSTNWEYLAEAALEFGQLEIAKRAQARLGNVGMVLSIKRMTEEAEDLNALQGEVAMMKGDFDLAEAKFLEAGLRERALEMRRDLQEWDKAMDMADKFNSPLISEIAREYAAVFEYNQDYSSAFALYKKAKQRFVGGRVLSMKHAMNQIISRSMAPGGGGGGNDQDAEVPNSVELGGGGDHSSRKGSYANPTLANNLTQRDLEIQLDIDKGLARNMLRLGMESEAIELLSSIAQRDISFVKECAQILEQEKKFEKAAKLYLESGEEGKAATCYIKLKQFPKAEEILKRKPIPQTWRLLAKAKEAEGNIIEAAKAYADAYDFENGIRLYLTLGIPEEAAALARMSDDPQDAVKVALYYLEKGMLDEALTYLIRSECYHDALANAFKYGKTEYYADLVFHHFKGEYPEGFAAGLGQVASDFEGKKDHFRAGKCYQYLKEYGKSFHLLLKAAHTRVQANEEEILVALVHTVVYAEDEDMSRQLVEFLLGENDGTPRDPCYLHYYYVMAEKFVEASKTAVIVSRSYQDVGSFMEARNSVFDSMCWMRSSGSGRFNKETIDQFNQTQGYMILKIMLNQKDKGIPARIIARLFDNISKFKKACPGLLLAGVNSCQQSGLKYSARQMAWLLIREYKAQLDEKFRPAIEQLVRKTAKVDCSDEPDNQSPCPSCNQEVEDFVLDCKFCKSSIPMCIVTGKHVIKSDLGACLGCNFPFRFSEMKRFQGLVKECPLCGVNWEGNSMKKLNDVRPYLYDKMVAEST